jgi:4'-phosphopantetheinyl transferase
MQNDKKENGGLPRVFSDVSFPIARPANHEILLVAGSCGSLANIKVSAFEQKRADGMRHEGSRERFLAGRRIVRGILSEWLSRAPGDLEISIGSDGKPGLKDGSDCHFSIAHSGDLVLAAFAAVPLGADTEEAREVDALGLARRFFSPLEISAVEDDSSRFFPLWTRREAAVKADGRGLARTLPLITSDIALSQSWCHVRIGESSWQTIAWRDGGHHLALAVETIPSAILWCDLRGLVW